MQNLKKKTSREIFESISNHCFTYTVPYKYGKQKSRGTQKYKDGRITAYEWINNLTYYYIKQEENLKDEFISYLKIKQEEIEVLREGEYKKGLQDAINEILLTLK